MSTPDPTIPKVSPAVDPPPPPPPRRLARTSVSLDELAAGVLRRDRGMLGRAFSLIESTERSQQQLALRLLERLTPHAGGAIRVGISGVPGSGKSTFIDRLGVMLVERGHKVAVLAVDPSSTVSGGSVLGDRTRMVKLAADERAFIRPSPSGGAAGGVASKTRESILVCEAAGFDVVLVETVGVGQSETAVAGMTDVLIALALPGAGDDLQGIKRGLLELVDVLVVNKADGDNAARAAQAAREYEMVVRLIRGGAEGRATEVLTCSALHGRAVADVWEAAVRRFNALKDGGQLTARRREQSLEWLRALIDERLHQLLRECPAAMHVLSDVSRGVLEGRVHPSQGADSVLLTLRRSLGARDEKACDS